MKGTLKVINQMQTDGIIGRYAIGGAVAATFYLEPSATLDLDIFVSLQNVKPGGLLTLTPVYEYLTSRGCAIEKEYLVIEGWLVQFLPPADALGEEALAQAIETQVDEVPTRVMTAEHLVAIALQTGRNKDFVRILQFIEAGVIDAARLDDILKRHHLLEKWEQFGYKFLKRNQ